MATKILISLPPQLATRMRATIPSRKRSKTIAQLIEQEVAEREKNLYLRASEIEKDQSLQKDMEAWEVTLSDGLAHETW
ncbi:MAG: hypothetical protein AAFQ78_01535 [Bacteroidota bacterium]